MEKWKEIPGYEGLYEVSSYGKVRSMSRLRIDKNGRPYTKVGKVLKDKDTNGYREVGLYKDSICTYFKIHRLVAMAFIPNPDNKPCVNHKDGNKANNIKSNLEWVTYGENSIHAVDSGLYLHLGENSHYAKLTEADVLSICSEIDSGARNSELASKYNVHVETIRNIKVGNTWNHLTKRKRLN